MSRREQHRTRHTGWLRAAVMGGDGILSTASLILGVAAAHGTNSNVLIAGIAGLVAGAMSMAAGEYVSVHSQKTNRTEQPVAGNAGAERTTANDLQNILYSTDVATLFLDKSLNIRFFTPATKALFAIIPSDIGRPLSDLNSLAMDADLVTDTATVLLTLEPMEREIETRSGACFIRRVLPYRTQNDGVEGVVITFADITFADSPNGGMSRTSSGSPSGRPIRRMPPKRASSPRQATTCASRCKLLPLCKDCRRRMSKRRGPRNLLLAWMRRWVRCREC